MAALNLNTASQAELEGVKGIGPVKAKAIMDYRKQHGDFKSVDELDNVRGIGEATIVKLKKQLFVMHQKPMASTNTNSQNASTVIKNYHVKTVRTDRPAKEPQPKEPQPKKLQLR